MGKNIVVGQSGGPTAVINSSVAGVYAQAKKLGIDKVYGMVHGIEGFLDDRICDLDDYLATPTGVDMLKRTPSAFLGTCRFKMPQIDGHEDVYEKVFEIMEKHDIDYLFYCGGNDSMDTVKMLSDYAAAHGKSQRFVGVPKTVDNDLPITDHCPGYGSAAKYIAASLKEVIRDNSSFGAKKPTVVIVEIMGRNAGWLTAAAALSRTADCEGPDAIYLPERVFDIDKFVDKIKELAKYKSSIVVAVSEGVKVADGRYVCEIGREVAVDAFGHKQMSGTAAKLADIVAAETGLKTRAIEFSTLQRAATHIASLTDINEAFQVGVAAVNAAEAGQTAMMITLDRNGDDPYQCGTSAHDIHDIANVERKVPDEWITAEGDDLTDDFEKYARPLIMGELTPLFVDGLPAHLVR